MSLRYVNDQLILARNYLALHGHSPALDSILRALDGLEHVEETIRELGTLQALAHCSQEADKDIRAAIEFGKSAEAHLKGGYQRG